MRTPLLLADFTHARVCKPFCEKFLTLPPRGIPAVPRIENGKCDPRYSLGRKKTDLPTNPKWQIGLFLCLKPFLGGAATPRSVVPLGG